MPRLIRKAAPFPPKDEDKDNKKPSDKPEDDKDTSKDDKAQNKDNDSKNSAPKDNKDNKEDSGEDKSSTLPSKPNPTKSPTPPSGGPSGGPATPTPAPKPMTPPGTLPGAGMAPPKPAKSLEDAKTELNSVSESANKLADAYLNLFEQLTSLYDDYPNLYNTMKMTARFPDNEQVQQIDQMRDNLNEMVNMYLSDDTYLSEAAGLSSNGGANSIPPAPKPAGSATPSLNTSAPDMHTAPGPVDTSNAKKPDEDDKDNSGNEEGLPESNVGQAPTPGMSPSSKEPFADVYRSSSKKRLRTQRGRK